MEKKCNSQFYKVISNDMWWWYLFINKCLKKEWENADKETLCQPSPDTTGQIIINSKKKIK